MGATGATGPAGADGATNPATLLEMNPTFLNGGALSTPSPSLLDVKPYSCADATGTVWLRTTGELIKDKNLPWGPGNAGGMGIGQISTPGTWYHVFAMMNGGVADAFIDTNVAGGNAPAGTTARRRIGSFFTNVTGQIFNFQQNGDLFTWCPLGSDSINIISQTLPAGPATATSFRNMLAPPGVQTVSLLTGDADIVSSSGSQSFRAVLYPTFMGSFTPDSFPGFVSVFVIGQGGQTGFDLQVMTDTIQNIGLGWASSATGTQININCRGYIDTRGKL